MQSTNAQIKIWSILLPRSDQANSKEIYVVIFGHFYEFLMVFKI
jgi:hypothetical protein